MGIHIERTSFISFPGQLYSSKWPAGIEQLVFGTGVGSSKFGAHAEPVAAKFVHMHNPKKHMVQIISLGRNVSRTTEETVTAPK